MDGVCKDFTNCDSSLCLKSRQNYRVNIFKSTTKTFKSLKKLFFCLPGLGSLQEAIGKCEVIAMNMKTKIVGINEVNKVVSSNNYAASLNCRDIFGELHIYLSCSEQCEYSPKCLLSNLKPTSCTNYPFTERVLTITAIGSLTVVFKKSDGTFYQDVFGCNNDHCIEFHKVCDLIDDCGDASDENSCTNNFKCNSGEYIPLSRKCNSKFDCLDFSDECNAQCDNQVKIFSHLTLCIAAWAAGLLSVFLNLWVLSKTLCEFKNLKTSLSRINSCFMVLISLGDFLQGTFLLLVAFADKFINQSSCFTQFKWTTSKTCNILGMISTIGSQLALFSMTILSFIRARGTRSMVIPSETMSIKSKVILAVEVFAIFFVAILLSTAPFFSMGEEYFVRSLAYENNLFVGDLDKSQHHNIIRAYYGRLFGENRDWKIIKRLVKDMFINNKVEGKEIGFYGNNGFCLFNYFVRANNPQKWFTGSVFLLNLICVLIVATCYIFVNISAQFSSSIHSATSNKAIVKRNKKIQRKVAVLIATDILSWIPFMIVALIHFFELVDASSWQSAFTIIVISCNSIINPLLILEDTLLAFGKQIWNRVNGLFIKKPRGEDYDTEKTVTSDKNHFEMVQKRIRGT